MATCKDCLQHDLCECVGTTKMYPAQSDGCRFFKDRNRFIEAPCKIGSTIYMIVTKRPKISLPEFSFIKTSYMTEFNFFRVCRDFGKTIFLTREEAEAALAERKMNDG